VVYYNGFTDSCEAAEVALNCGTAQVKIQLEPGECVLLLEGSAEGLSLHRSARQQREECEKALDLSRGWQVCCAKPKERFEDCAEETVEVLSPISDEHPKLSCRIRYRKEFELPERPKAACFHAEQVYEVMSVRVNGKEVGSVLTPPYQTGLGDSLQAGRNVIEVEVATTPARDQLNYPQPPFDFTHEALEPTGMFGKVTLYYVR
jgi:hypothetical protein